MSHDREVEHPGGSEGDLLESPPTMLERLGDRWSLLPKRRRLAVATMVAVLVVASLSAFVVSKGRAWIAERSLDDHVELQATMGVTASSTTPSGGSVDFYVSVLNRGPRSVSITSIDIAGARLRITSTNEQPAEVKPGLAVSVPLSVLLDCSDAAVGDPSNGLRGGIDAVASNGRPRVVDTTFDQSTIVTDIADTLCRIDPDLRNVELDGAVNQPR